MKRMRLPLARPIALMGGLLLGEPGCFGNPDRGDSVMTTSTLGVTTSPSGDDDGGGADGEGTTAGDDDAADDGDGITAGADDAPADDGMDDGAACVPPCAVGEECIAGQCFGGGDDGSAGEPATCGTNVALTNATCDECVKEACCDQMQACFGDETVVVATSCFELNNCIAMNCTTAADLQMCIDESCAEYPDEVDAWVAFQQCAGMNCMAACA